MRLLLPRPKRKLVPFVDPITGDTLPRLEYYTRQVQVFVRTPAFILFFNAVTLIAMFLGRGDIWNYFASWLAIIIEWLVGTYMFGQTGRDAVVTREIRAIAHRLEDLIELLVDDVEGIEDELEKPEGERKEEAW